MVNVSRLLADKKRLLLIGGPVLVALLAVIAFFVFFHEPKKPTPQQEGISDPYADHLKTLESEQPPADPLGRALYYGQVAMSHYELKQYDQALDSYFKAEQIIEDNGLRMQYAFYQPIADVYKAKGDKQQERVYLEKHLAYLKEYLEQVKPDDGGMTANAITFFEERIKNL